MGDEKRPHCPTEKKDEEFCGDQDHLHCFAIITIVCWRLAGFRLEPVFGR